LLEDELRFLQEVNGKIKKQDVGPIQTKDLADCLMVCVDQLLEDNFRRMETRQRLGSTQLLAAAQGGYHTPIVTSQMQESESSARQKLRSFGNAGKYDYAAMSGRSRGNPRR
jgi:hypothetical protein